LTRRDARDVALWDVDTHRVPPRVRDLEVGPVSVADVDEFAHRFHYAGSAGSALWRYGLWHDVTLWGVVAFNLPTRSVCDSVFGPEHWEHVVHMGRLVLADNAPRNSESRLIGGALRELARDQSHVWAVVTYAATDVGHLGYVYQATNAIYTGTGGDPIFHTDKDGVRHGTYLSGHVNAERAASLGWTRHRGEGKHRYVYVLGSRTQRRHRLALLRFPVLPYPKEVTSLDGLELEA
jgi:hypothetical protein